MAESLGGGEMQAGTCCPLVLVPTVLGFSGRGARAASLLCSAEEARPWRIRRKPWTDPLGQHPWSGRATPSSPVEASWELGL